MFIKIVTKKSQKEEEALLLRKLRFMGQTAAERATQTGIVDYDKIALDAINVAAADDVIA